MAKGKQESAVRTAFLYNLSVITGSPGTGKTTVLKIILAVYRRLYSDRKIVLMAPTGRASRRMAESTGFDGACTMHSGLGLVSEEDEGRYYKQLLAENGLPDIRWHDLRSTYCTLLLKGSFNPKAVSKLMGHAKEIITMDVYADNRGIIADAV